MADSISLFGIKIHRLTMTSATGRVLDWCDRPRDAVCRYVVTPNVDHAVMYQHRDDVRTAYRDAALVLADGAPIVWASRLLGQRLPERVAGSDLVPAILRAASRRVGDESTRMRVFLLGAAPGVADEAAAAIRRHYRGVDVVGTYSPPLGFEHDNAENQEILQRIADAKPDLLIVGLGAPKQELWVQQHHKRIEAKVALCVGATIDFLAGHRRRSPVWMQRVGLEWLHRIASEPRRLVGRYARDAWVFPQLVWRELRGGHGVH
jgi:N-acetylglucosaminyldiphosphoundecaprenol N-acetyl-beta-D-mannosaminyltransferase